LIVVLGRPFVKRFALCYRTVVLSVLSVTLVYCGQTVGWVKMKLGTDVGLGSRHRREPMQLHTPEKRGTAPIFSPCPLWPKGWMDKDATWYESRPRPRSHCVRLEPSPSSHKKRSKAPNFWPMYCGQTAELIKMPVSTEGGLGLGHILC